MKFLLLFLFISCSNLFYQPTRVSYLDPRKFVTQLDDIWFKSKNGTNLNGWWMPSTKMKPKGTIVFFHGNAQNISTHFLNLAWITHEGYNLFIFDYSGYGASEGKPSQENVFHDSIAALDKGFALHQKTSPEAKFIVYGQSLGGVISLRTLASWPEKEKVDLIVQDSTFMSYKDIAFDKLKDHWVTFLISPLAFILVSDEYASDEVISEIKNPLLVISGKKDHVVPFKFSEEIYKASQSEKKWFWKIENGTHTDVFAFHGHKYRKDFLDFLATLL